MTVLYVALTVLYVALPVLHPTPDTLRPSRPTPPRRLPLTLLMTLLMTLLRCAPVSLYLSTCLTVIDGRRCIFSSSLLLSSLELSDTTIYDP